MNDARTHTEAIRDRGTLLADAALEAVTCDPGGRRAVGPVTVDLRGTDREIGDLAKAQLGRAAKMPIEAMLFATNKIFLKASISRLAPQIDLLAEIA